VSGIPSPLRRAAAAAALLGLFVAGGCGARQGADVAQQREPEYYGSLPGLKATSDQQLQDESARITEEGGTPALIGRPMPAQQENVAAGLAGLFPPDEIPAILEQSEEIFQRVFPPGRFDPDPLRLQGTTDFCNWYEARRLRARDALRRPQCNFSIPFTAGLLADWTFIDEVRICARLEAFQAARSLDGDELDGAIESLRLMLRLAHWLGAERVPMARLEAAFLRTEAFRVLQAVVQDEGITREQLDQLYEMVEAQLTAWPDDADAWIGDRALGLHAYELVRAGRLKDLLTDAEIEQYEQEGTLEGMLIAALRGVDQDELYYLQSMREIIDSCRRPYHTRVPMLDSIDRELQAKQDARQLPVVAATVLGLPDVREGQIIQAQDRANWEAWALALAMATGRQPPAYQINPLTGQQYTYLRHDGTIEVSRFGSGAGGDNPSIVVPDLGGEE
jgi:hypothetical protein